MEDAQTRVGPGLPNVITRFTCDNPWRRNTIRANNWDEAGDCAREADLLAWEPREAVTLTYEERENRNYWRQVATNRTRATGAGGNNTHRTGCIPPGTSRVPGETPSDKGNAKGKSHGKRTRADYEEQDPWAPWSAGHRGGWKGGSWKGGSSSSSGGRNWSGHWQGY